MDNNQSRVAAYNSFYEQGMARYGEGDLAKAKELLLRAAEEADAISTNSSNYTVKMEYHNLALKLLAFVKTKCVKAKPREVTGSAEGEEKKLFIPEEATGVTFNDVAGLEDVKEQIRFKVLAPLESPELAKKYKITPGGKILLYGPPGTGKTFIAKAIAGEVKAVFYAVNCQDLISKYMGDSSKQLDALFEEALKNEKAIIFFDEFDSVASKRGDGSGGVDAEMARFVATFLTKVDGFKKSKTNKMLLLIAATNRPWALDSAMLRGGRFDTQIYVGVPDLEARKFLVNKALKGLPLSGDVNLDAFSAKLEGYGGGDVVSICDKVRLEAYKRSIKNKREENILNSDFDKVLKGHRNVITDAELQKFTKYKQGLEI